MRRSIGLLVIVPICVLVIVIMLQPRVSFSVELPAGSVELPTGQEKIQEIEQIAGNLIACTKLKIRMVKQDRALKKLDKEIRKLYERKRWIEISDATYALKGTSYDHRVVVGDIKGKIAEIDALRAGAVGLMQEYGALGC